MAVLNVLGRRSSWSHVWRERMGVSAVMRGGGADVEAAGVDEGEAEGGGRGRPSETARLWMVRASCGVRRKERGKAEDPDEEDMMGASRGEEAGEEGGGDKTRTEVKGEEAE